MFISYNARLTEVFKSPSGVYYVRK